MLKKEFIDEMQTHMKKATKKEIGEFIDAFTETVAAVLAKGDIVKLPNLGTFKMRRIAEHSGVNPKTKENINIPEKVTPCFKVAVGLKNALAK